MQFVRGRWPTSAEALSSSLASPAVTSEESSLTSPWTPDFLQIPEEDGQATRASNCDSESRAGASRL